MYPFLEILGISIPTYWLCAVFGLGLCILFGVKNRRRFPELESVDISNSAAIGFIGVIVGARLLYFISIIPLVYTYWDILMADRDLLWEILYTGMVYYGGLFGFIIAVEIYLKKYRLNSQLFWDFLTPCIPLFHAFGRLGCFLTGCCHGKESERFGIIFERSISAPGDIPLFPLQLFGFAGELVIFAITVNFEKKHHKEGICLPFYLSVYAVCRFFYEFFRGDTARGIWGPFSTSQWISLFLLAYLAFYWHGKINAKSSFEPNKE